MAGLCWTRALGQASCQLRARATTNLRHANTKCSPRPQSFFFARNWSSSSSKRSTPPPPPPTKEKPTRSTFGRVVTVARWSAFAGASCVASVLFIGGAIFLHDAFTYTDRHAERVPVNPLALHPENGGPKDLPIARVLVGDEEDEINKQLSQKPRLVIIGGGWGVSSYPVVVLGTC